MPVEAIITLVFFMILIMIPAIVISVLSIKNVKQHLTKNIDGHMIEIVTGYYIFQLLIDGKVVDEVKSFQRGAIKLQGSFDGKQVKVNIGSGFVKPQINTFIDETKISELSNY